MKSAKIGSSVELLGIRIHHMGYIFTPDLVVIAVFCQTLVFAKKKRSKKIQKNMLFSLN